MELLNSNIIDSELQELPYWELQGLTIVREIATQNFAGAVGLINAIAILSEKADHHPDILLYGWNKLRITLTTHQIGGLSQKDIELAKEIENIIK